MVDIKRPLLLLAYDKRIRLLYAKSEQWQRLYLSKAIIWNLLIAYLLFDVIEQLQSFGTLTILSPRCKKFYISFSFLTLGFGT